MVRHCRRFLHTRIRRLSKRKKHSFVCIFPFLGVFLFCDFSDLLLLWTKLKTQGIQHKTIHK